MASIVLKHLSELLERKFLKRDKDGYLVIGPEDHPLSPELICPQALEVVRVLKENNYQAYLVGGCIRDLLMGLKPKDFDVATNATPNDVKQLFRRSRIVGRRFQIAHVQFGRDIIEVTTFRSDTSKQGNSAKNGRRLQQSATGVLTRDNVFGSIKDDAHRRDLTVNALYYDPIDNSLHDFCRGLVDLEKGTIRMIGDPATRYREDPVRLLRVARFAAKLNFRVDPKTLKPIAKTARNLSHISAPRLFDETIKLFMSGQGQKVFELLMDFQLFEQIFPQTNRLINQGNSAARALVEQALINTDLRIQNNKRVTPAFIYAALLWPAVQQLASSLQNSGQSPSVAINKASNEVITNQVAITAIPKRFTLAMREIWSLQLMLSRRAGNRAKRLAEHPRFRAGYDFVLLREQVGEDLQGLGDWWTRYQQVDEQQQLKMVEDLPPQRNPRRRNRRRKSRHN